MPPSLSLVVKLDAAGHVCGTRPGPVSEGWMRCPAHVAAQPYRHKLCFETGWTEKTLEEHAEFEARHTPAPPPEHPSKAELRTLLANGGPTDGHTTARALRLLADLIL